MMSAGIAHQYPALMDLWRDGRATPSRNEWALRRVYPGEVINAKHVNKPRRLKGKLSPDGELAGDLLMDFRVSCHYTHLARPSQSSNTHKSIK